MKVKFIKRDTGLIMLEFWHQGKRYKASTGLKGELDDYAADLHDIEGRIIRMIQEKRKLTRELIQERVQGKLPEEADLYSVLDHFIRSRQSIVRQSTTQTYYNMRKHLYDFAPNLSFDDISTSWGERFNTYLISLGFNNNTCGKVLTRFKAFMKWAEGDYHQNVYYRKISYKRNPKTNVHLTLDELKKLIELDLSGTPAAVRDGFVLRCFTGIRFSDMVDLSPAMVVGDYLKKEQVKTSRPVKIPLTDIARKIILEGSYRPILSNQKSNKIIKDICEKAGINSPVVVVQHYGNKRKSVTYPKYKLIGTHTARKSCACILYQLGVRPDDIAVILGVDVKTVKHYLEIDFSAAAMSMKEALKGF